jgi:sugar lactone lactonase YvrE
MQVIRAYPSQNILGEGPLWNVKDKAIYWVDIIGKKIQRYFPEDDKYEAFNVPLQVGMVAFRKQGEMVCATENGFYFWKIGAQEMEFIAHPEAGKEGARFNDGKVDRKGRLWAGTMTPEGASSALYRLDPDMKVSKMVDGATISNGIGWNPDNTIMYYADSNRYVINAFDYNKEKGTLSNQRPFVQLDGKSGVPDGLTVDIEGYVWCAIYDGWRVMRYTPTGDIATEIKMPISKPSSCIFGGENMDELYITTISDGLTAKEKENERMAGDLFMVKTDTKGLPEPFFAG